METLRVFDWLSSSFLKDLTISTRCKTDPINTVYVYVNSWHQIAHVNISHVIVSYFNQIFFFLLKRVVSALQSSRPCSFRVPRLSSFGPRVTSHSHRSVPLWVYHPPGDSRFYPYRVTPRLPVWWNLVGGTFCSAVSFGSLMTTSSTLLRVSDAGFWPPLIDM